MFWSEDWFIFRMDGFDLLLDLPLWTRRGVGNIFLQYALFC